MRSALIAVPFLCNALSLFGQATARLVARPVDLLPRFGHRVRAGCGPSFAELEAGSPQVTRRRQRSGGADEQFDIDCNRRRRHRVRCVQGGASG